MHSIIRPSPRSALFLILSVAFLVAVGGCGHRQINTSKASPDRAVKGARAQGKVDNPNKKVSDPEPNKTGKAPTYKPPPQQGPQLELSQKGVTLRWIEDGNVRMSATAREFQGNEVAKVGTLLDFSAQLYENGKMTASVRAPKAVADTANRVVTATGGVVVKSIGAKHGGQRVVDKMVCKAAENSGRRWCQGHIHHGNNGRGGIRSGYRPQEYKDTQFGERIGFINMKRRVATLLILLTALIGGDRGRRIRRDRTAQKR